MAIPTNKEEFIQHCLRTLGEPVTKVNVSIEQCEDRVDEALFRFHERHPHATQQEYILYNFQRADLESGYIILPPDIQAVTEIFLPSYSAGMFSMDFQLQMENLFSTSTVAPYGDLTYWFMTQSNITLINRMFTPQRNYTFNPLNQKLVIDGGNRNTAINFGGIVIKAFRKIYGDVVDVPGGESNALIYNIWADRWLQNYTTALLHRQWARNILKFTGVPLLGGVVLDGKTMMDTAQAEIDVLEKELRDDIELPPGFSMA